MSDNLDCFNDPAFQASIEQYADFGGFVYAQNPALPKSVTPPPSTKTSPFPPPPGGWNSLGWYALATIFDPSTPTQTVGYYIPVQPGEGWFWGVYVWHKEADDWDDAGYPAYEDKDMAEQAMFMARTNTMFGVKPWHLEWVVAPKYAYPGTCEWYQAVRRPRPQPTPSFPINNTLPVPGALPCSGTTVNTIGTVTTVGFFGEVDYVTNPDGSLTYLYKPGPDNPPP